MITTIIGAVVSALLGLGIWWLKTRLLAPKSPVEQVEVIDDAEKRDLADQDPTGKATSDDLGSGRF